MFSVNLHEFKPIQALDCINLNMIIHKYELLPGLIGALLILAMFFLFIMFTGNYKIIENDLNAVFQLGAYLYQLSFNCCRADN